MLLYKWKGVNPMSRVFWGLVMFLLVGCGTITNTISTPTAVTAINREDAIKLGLKVAYGGGLKFVH